MKNIVISMFSLLVLVSCGGKNDEATSIVDSVAANRILLTSAQYKAANIALGRIEQMPVTKSITINGMLDVPPQNLVTISAPMGGFIKSTKLLQGMKVRKGEVLVTLENQEYIQLQQDYLDNASKLEFLESEYSRQTELATENVNSKKALQLAKSQYESAKALVNGLEAKLAMINISTESLKKGKISSSINLYSPIDGFVTQVNVNIGQFVNASDAMFNIVNLDHVHAELQVYEKDITKIRLGQKVSLQLPGEKVIRLASVFLVGKEINADRTVRVHCHLETEDAGLLPGMFITAQIETSSEIVDVVSTRALVNFEGTNFVFVPDGENQFNSVPVQIGNSVGEFTEIVLPDGFNKDTPIVVSGAFELLGLLKNTQE